MVTWVGVLIIWIILRVISMLQVSVVSLLGNLVAWVSGGSTYLLWGSTVRVAAVELGVSEEDVSLQ